jgi:hypothetical protein
MAKSCCKFGWGVAGRTFIVFPISHHIRSITKSQTGSRRPSPTVSSLPTSSTRHVNMETQRRTAESEYVLSTTLHDDFGIDLSTDELAAVHATIRRLAEQPGARFALD